MILYRSEVIWIHKYIGVFIYPFLRLWVRVVDCPNTSHAHRLQDSAGTHLSQVLHGASLPPPSPGDGCVSGLAAGHYVHSLCTVYGGRQRRKDGVFLLPTDYLWWSCGGRWRGKWRLLGRRGLWGALGAWLDAVAKGLVCEGMRWRWNEILGP